MYYEEYVIDNLKKEEHLQRLLKWQQNHRTSPLLFTLDPKISNNYSISFVCEFLGALLRELKIHPKWPDPFTVIHPQSGFYYGLRVVKEKEMIGYLSTPEFSKKFKQNHQERPILRKIKILKEHIRELPLYELEKKIEQYSNESLELKLLWEEITFYQTILK